MTMESTFLPVPSEIVIPPAAYLAQNGELNLLLVIFFGVLGSTIGAVINYILGLTLGRSIVYSLAASKWTDILFLNEARIKKAEDYFLRYGNSSTFIGRLVPGIRHLISIPAGFTKMNFKNFVFYTVLGSVIWVTLLAILGYEFGANQELIKEYYREICYGAFVLVILFVIYIIYKNKKAKNFNASK